MTSTPVPGHGTHPAEPSWKIMTLFLLTLAVVVLCAYIARPLFFAIAGAIIVAVVTEQPHNWLRRRLGRPNLAAALMLAAVTVAIIGPGGALVESVTKRALVAANALNSGSAQDKFSDTLEQHPRLTDLLSGPGVDFDLKQGLRRGAAYLAPKLGQLLGNSIRVITQLVIMLFILFFLYRDRDVAIETLRSLLPLSDSESDQLLTRITETIYAAALGRLVIACVQGSLAGLAFWTLGVPIPFLWGVLTAFVALIPPLGAFLVWVPVALYLGFHDHWIKALLLTIWGSVVVSTIDNFLFPILVGTRLQLHTAAILVSVLGGIALVGLPGIVLGPVALTVARVLLEIWHARTTAVAVPEG